MKKGILLLITCLVITGCRNSGKQEGNIDSTNKTDELSSNKDISAEFSFQSVEDVIKRLKSNGIPIQYSIVYTNENDPNGSGKHDYLKKGNFSDSNIESDYDKQEPLSGTIEIFHNNSEAKQRIKYLENLKRIEAIDNFPYRIVSENVLLRLNSKYSKKQLNQFADIMNGELLGEEALPEFNFDNVPIVTYDDILTGKYNGQIVCIDAIIDKINKPSKSIFHFALWFPTDKTYVYEGSCQLPYKVEEDVESVFINANNGDIIKYITQIYDDGSFGTAQIFAAKVIGKQNIDDVHSKYKLNCAYINYEDILRNPESYKGVACKFTGTIFQIINENASRAEYLISTESGNVYVNWYDNTAIRGSRFLENDNVTVYGNLSMLKTYNTVVNQKTVPEISVTIMELNQ